MREHFEETKLHTVMEEKRVTEILDRLDEHQHRVSSRPLIDQQTWLLLFVGGFLATDVNQERGLACLFDVLTKGQQGWAEGRKVKMEVQPMAPRVGAQGNTELDLICGDIETREGTKLGIRFQPGQESSWVCMVEAKWLSDTRYLTRRDSHHNPLACIIENALTFQSHEEEPRFPDKAYVTLLTPARFEYTDSDQGSRLYFHKFREYSDREAILRDIESCEVGEKRNQPGWRYPDLRERVRFLELYWVTFEELFEAMPDSSFKQEFGSFIAKESQGVLTL